MFIGTAIASRRCSCRSYPTTVAQAVATALRYLEIRRYVSDVNLPIEPADLPSGPTLSMDLSPWEITLHTAEVLKVHAHAYGRDGGDYVFEALVEGDPRKTLELLRIPQKLVAKIRSRPQASKDPP